MNRRKLLSLTAESCSLLAALLCAATLAACAPRVPGAEHTLARATDFSLQAVDGSTVHLSDSLGKEVVMISFWATWCGPCLGEMPALEVLHQRYRNQGFKLLSVAMDGPDTLANVEPTVRRFHISYPVLLDQETRVVSVYNPTRDAPFTVLIGRDGRIAETRVGYSPGDETQLEAQIRKLIAAPAPVEGAAK